MLDTEGLRQAANYRQLSCQCSIDGGELAHLATLFMGASMSLGLRPISLFLQLIFHVASVTILSGIPPLVCNPKTYLTPTDSKFPPSFLRFNAVVTR